MYINKKKNSKSFKERFTHSEKLKAMKLIEDIGSITAAANELSVNRVTLQKWKAELWEEYLENKDVVHDAILTTESKKLMTFGATEKITSKSVKLYEKAIDYFLKENEEGVCNFDKLPPKEKVQLVNVIAPYVMEKRSVLGIKDQNPTQQNNFFAQVFYDLKKGNDGKYISSIQGNRETASVSGE